MLALAALLGLLSAAACGTAGGSSPAVSSAVPAAEGPPQFDIADPAQLRIPRIGVDAAFQRLDPAPDGELPPPTNNDDVGWWGAGPEPGEVGAAVVAGHVDSYQGPAVLYRLRELSEGDEIEVDTADGDVLRFRVDSVERFPKDAFPTARVYDPTPVPTLRLVTCGGAFNRTERSYVDNVIAFATLVPD